MEHVSSSEARRHVASAYAAAADALEDTVVQRSREDDRRAIAREIAIEAAGRCYERAISRVAQIKVEPDAKQHLVGRALEARKAGDDIMKAAGLDPKDHPLDAKMWGRRPGLLFDLVRYPEFAGNGDT
jgi:hypothetical protein